MATATAPSFHQRQLIRKKHTILFYRTKTLPEWTLLPPTRNKESLENVEDFILDGAIKFTQPGVQGTTDEKTLWQSCIEQSGYKNIHIDELQTALYQRPTITIQVDIVRNPLGHLEQYTLPNQSKKRTAEDMEEAEENNPFKAIFTIPPAPESFPLARLSQNYDEDGYVGILLAFERSPAKKKALKWSWPDALGFLAGRKGWRTAPVTAAESDKIEALSLEDMAKVDGTVPTGWRLVRAERGSWLHRVEDKEDKALPSVSPPAAFHTGPKESRGARSAGNTERALAIRKHGVAVMREQLQQAQKAIVVGERVLAGIKGDLASAEGREGPSEPVEAGGEAPDEMKV